MNSRLTSEEIKDILQVLDPISNGICKYCGGHLTQQGNHHYPDCDWVYIKIISHCVLELYGVTPK